jgi:small subunit ribosomal protein S8
MNYTIGDFMIRIKNAYMAHRNVVEAPYSKASLSIGKILVTNKFIEKIEEVDEEGRKKLVVTLRYAHREPAMTQVKIFSTPSLHHYIKKDELSTKTRGLGIHIISTSKGIMSHRDAMKEGVGGKLLFQVS